MKKLLALVIFVFLLSGCTLSNENSEYKDYLDELKNASLSTLEYDYNINLILEEFSDDENIYQVVIDDFINIPNDLKVLLYHDAKTDDIFPSYGFYDEGDFDSKGLNLLGYINKDEELPITFKVMIITNDIKNIHIFTFDSE